MANETVREFVWGTSGQSLHSAEETKESLKELSVEQFDSIRLSGNSLSVEAAKVVAEILKKQVNLKVTLY